MPKQCRLTRLTDLTIRKQELNFWTNNKKGQTGKLSDNNSINRGQRARGRKTKNKIHR